MRRGRNNNNNNNANNRGAPRRRLGFNNAAAQPAIRRLAFNNAGPVAAAAAALPPVEEFAAPPPPPAEPSLLPYSNDMENSGYTFDKCFRIDGQYYHLVRPNGSKNAVTVAAIPTEKYNTIAELLDHPGIYTYILFEDGEFRSAKALNPGEVLSKHKNLHRNSGGKRILLAGEIQVRPGRSVLFNFLSGTYMPHIARRFTLRYPGTDAATFFSNALRQRFLDAGASAVEFDPRTTEEASLITTDSSEAAIAPFLAMDPPYTRHGPYPTAEACRAAKRTSLQQGGRRKTDDVRGPKEEAIAVFRDGPVEGEAVATAKGRDTILNVEFTKIPPGEHGFHIHRAGDLRGKGCQGACAHYHKGRPAKHGAGPGTKRQRHTGDLGNVSGQTKRRYTLKNLRPAELFGRTLIVHADRDDLGLGGHEDSHTTGHSGNRIACAIFGRGMGCK